MLIDFLRGFCLLVMTINHLPHGFIEKVSWQTFGFISAAEGFVFLSGFVSGWVYGRTAVTQGISASTSRILRRGFILFVSNAIFMTFAMLAAREHLATLGDGFHPSWSLWFRTLFFLAAPAYSEILRMYCIFFLFIPAVFWALINKRGYLIVIASLGLWLLAAQGWGITSLPENGYFDVLSWQLLFVAGVCLAFRTFHQNKQINTSNALTVGCLITVGTFFVIRHWHFIEGKDLTPYFTWLNSWRRTLPVARLVDFFAFAYVIYRFRSPLENLVKTRFGRALVYLGQHSLPVFIWSASASMIAYAEQHRWEHASQQEQIAFTLLIVASCFIPAWMHARWQALGKEFFPGLRLAPGIPRQ
jgi:hypothetical protein